MSQFDAQKPGLDCVKPSVIALDIMVVLLGLTMITDHPDLCCNLFIVARHRAGFAACSQILSRVETKSRGISHGARLQPGLPFFRIVLSSVRLASILDHQDPKLPRDLRNCIHIRYLTVQMDRNYRPDPQPEILRDDLAIHISRTLCFQKYP